MKPLKIFTAFSGYDSQMVALKNRLNLDCELVGWSEIDKYAIQAHNALFPEYQDRNFGDINKINWAKVPHFDLFTYSSPCQDFSVAGMHQGGEKKSGTRSSLLWECERAIRTRRPKYLLFENVVAVIQKNHIDTFRKWCKRLEFLGYTNYYENLNALDFNVPQSRHRIYMVSILGDEKFTFPAKKRLTKTLEDVVDKKVPEKYYLDDNGLKWRIEEHIRRIEAGRGERFELRELDDTAKCITTDGGGRIGSNFLISPRRDHQRGNILSWYKTKTFRTITTSQTNSTSQWLKYAGQIRRLTPKECFRLMGLNDSEAETLVHSGISDTQLYKLAGNSIVVDVLAAIFAQLFGKGKGQGSQKYKKTLQNLTQLCDKLKKLNQQKRKQLCNK